MITTEQQISNKIPGFIDIHNHGAAGVDVNTATAEDLRTVSKFLASQGVTGWLPTFVPDSIEVYQSVCAAIDDVMATQDLETAEPAARILGVHYEGIFANKQMCGALRPEFFRTFTRKNEIDDLPVLKSRKAVHLTTLAPEIDGGIELIAELKKRGWIISIGHTNADSATLDQAYEAGASHITHLFNAMTGIHHRDLGVAGWALTRDEITCEIIPDGIHVHPKMLKFAYQNKTAERLALVSDSVAPTGQGDGNFRLWGENISVVDGRTKNERGSIAGSVITMLDAFRIMRGLGISLEEVSRMASHVPAKILGLDELYGSPDFSLQEDYIEIDQENNIVKTVVGGRVAFTLSDE